MHTSDTPWSLALKDERFLRGCHQSATEHDEFLRDELATFMDNRFWMVLPYDLVRNLEHPQLSPAGVVPQRERRPRLICDHTWYPVNELSLPNVPPETMQFGRALYRILHSVRHANP